MGHPAVLDDLLGPVDPDVKKWASVLIISDQGEQLDYTWHHYGQSAVSNDFWPASTIKLYAVIAAYEFLNELEMPDDSILVFERKTDECWHIDAARTMPEMVNEIFRRSSNEDYTLLLRFVGIDRMNRLFLHPDRGFPKSALMRGYVLGRPYEYRREEPQRITVRSLSGEQRVVEHEWSGHSYSRDRGATIISDTTGNCTTTKELVDCLRRLLLHDALPEEERFKITSGQAHFIAHGDGELTGLENKAAGAYAWTETGEKYFPDAVFYHKGGWISSYSLDLAGFNDPESGAFFLLAVAAETGDTSTIKSMLTCIFEWMKMEQASD